MSFRSQPLLDQLSLIGEAGIDVIFHLSGRTEYDFGEWKTVFIPHQVDEPFFVQIIYKK